MNLTFEEMKEILGILWLVIKALITIVSAIILLLSFIWFYGEVMG